MDSKDNNSGDESSTTTFGGERSVALLPGVSKVKVYCGNGTMGGSADVENASNRTRTYARLSTRTSSDPATAVTNDSVDRIRCVVTYKNEKYYLGIVSSAAESAERRQKAREQLVEWDEIHGMDQLDRKWVHEELIRLKISASTYTRPGLYATSSHDDNEGLTPPTQTAELRVGDKVEVYYEPEEAYFAAVIKKVVYYEDDVRYTVRYTIDRSTQANVKIDFIRLIKSKSKKKLQLSQNAPDEQELHPTTTLSKKALNSVEENTQEKQRKHIYCQINYKGQHHFYLGMVASVDESVERRQKAREKLDQWDAMYGGIDNIDRNWINEQFIKLNIKVLVDGSSTSKQKKGIPPTLKKSPKASSISVSTKADKSRGRNGCCTNPTTPDNRHDDVGFRASSTVKEKKTKNHISCQINYKGQHHFYLGMVASVDESVERRQKAREKLDQWDAMYGGIGNIDRNWINEQFIKLNIKVLVDGSSTSKQKKGIPPTLKKSPKASSISVSTKADKSRGRNGCCTNPTTPDNRHDDVGFRASSTVKEKKTKNHIYCQINYKGQQFYLGMVASVDESVERREKAREKLDQWDAMYGGIDNIDRNWINEQFIKLNIKVLVDGSSTSKQKKGIPPTLKKSPKASSISVSTKADKSKDQRSSHIYPEKNDDNDFTLHLVFLAELGSFGMIAEKEETKKSPRNIFVEKLQQDGQAARNGIRINDLIFKAPSKYMDMYSKAGEGMLLDIDHDDLDVSKLQSPTLEDLLGMSKSTLRPVAFLLKRFVSRQEIEEERACTNVQKTGEIKGNDAMRVTTRKDSPTCHDSEKEGREVANGEKKEEEDISRKKETAATEEKDETTRWVDNKGGSNKVRNEESRKEKTTKLTTAGSMSSSSSQVHEKTITPNRQCPLSRQVECQAMPVCGGSDSVHCKAVERKKVKSAEKSNREGRGDKTATDNQKGAIRNKPSVAPDVSGKGPYINRVKKKMFRKPFERITPRGRNTNKAHRTCKGNGTKRKQLSGFPSSKLRKKKATRTHRTKSQFAESLSLSSSTHENIPTQNKPLKLTDDNSLPKWIPSHNPWGNRGHCEGDFVLFSSSDYRTAFQPHVAKPKRFTFEPFAEDSSYCKTHVTPQEGVRILEVTRDRLALRAWGFDFCHHDFGGACLVTEVEPLSPADAAIDVGCCRGDVSALQVNDMILCINGKKVSGMTVVDFEVELEVSLSQILLVVAKCRTSVDEPASAYERIGLEETLHWTEVGGDACMRMDGNFRLDGFVESDDDEVVDLDVDVCDRLDKANRTNEGDGSGSESSSCSSPRPGSILGVHCDTKDTVIANEGNNFCWEPYYSKNAEYITAHDPIVFTDVTANDEENCLRDINVLTHSSDQRPIDDAQRKNQRPTDRLNSNAIVESEWGNDSQTSSCTAGENDLLTPEKKMPTSFHHWTQKYNMSPIRVGTLVYVTPRLERGSNKPGGAAKVTDYQTTEDDILYDVRYVLSGGREKKLESMYVTLYEEAPECRGDITSPGITTRGASLRNFL